MSRNENEKQSILNLLGLARRARKLALGNDPVKEALRMGDTRLVLVASDLSPRSAGGIKITAEETGTPLVTLDDITMDEISMALGKRTGVVAVKDAGFAKKLHALCAVK